MKLDVLWLLNSSWALNHDSDGLDWEIDIIQLTSEITDNENDLDKNTEEALLSDIIVYITQKNK